MGNSTISMAIFNCYVSSPEGNIEMRDPEMNRSNTGGDSRQPPDALPGHRKLLDSASAMDSSSVEELVHRFIIVHFFLL